MGMSQGTYTFLACFAGFWLIWALIVLLCCLCSFVQRRLKSRQEERLARRSLRSAEMEPLGCHSAGGHHHHHHPPTLLPPPPPLLPPPAASAPTNTTLPLPLSSLSSSQPQPPQLPREPSQYCPAQPMSPTLPLPVPHPLPQANWVSMPDTDIFGKPPCYEDAVLMEDPPPPYSEVLADPRGGTYIKPAPLSSVPPPPLLPPPPPREHQDPAPVYMSETNKPPVMAMFPERGYSSLIRLPSSQRWDSLGHLLSNMDLNHNNLTPPGPCSVRAYPSAAIATMPRREPRTHREGFGTRRGIQGVQGSLQGIREGIQGFNGGTQGHLGGVQGHQGGVQGLQGGLQVFQGRFSGLQGVHGLRGLEPSCGLPTAFPLLGRSTAV